MKKLKFEEEEEEDSEASHPFISEEIILDILIRVDSKTLIRSKSVCRNWLNWISNQSFLNNFIRKTKSNPPLIDGILCRYGDIRKADDVQAYFISTTSESLSDIVIKDNSLSFLTTNTGNNDVYIVDSNNGVLLCAKKPHYKLWNPISQANWNPKCYFVCNPVNKHWVSLPESKYFELNEGALLHCYDKDVNGVFAQKTECFVYCFRKKHPGRLEVEIYSSETGKWGERKQFHYNWCVREFNCLTLLNKCAYWLQEYGKVAVCDLDAKTLRFIAPSIRHMFALHVGVSSGSIYFVDRTQDSFFVWVLGVDGQLCWHQDIKLGELEQVAGSGPSGLVFKFLGFDQVTYKILLVGIGQEYATLFCLDRDGLMFSRAVNKSFFCNFDLKVFPYALPAWPTCIPFIQKN